MAQQPNNPSLEQEIDALPKQDGVPVLNITPAPEASVPTDIQIVEDSRTPIVGKSVRFRSLQPEVTQSVESRVEGPRTYEDVLEQLDAGFTVNITTGTGTKSYSGPNAAKLARTPAIQKRIKVGLAIENSRKQQQQEQTVKTSPDIAFVKPDTGEIDVSYLPPDIRSSAEEYATGRKALDDTLRPFIDTGRQDIDTIVRQYFVDEFSTGEVFENLATRLAESGRGIAVLPGYAANYAASAVEAMRRSIPSQIDIPFTDKTVELGGRGTSFSDEWAALQPKREQMTKDYLEQLEAVLPAATAARGFNEAIHERAKSEMSEEEYQEFGFTTAEDGTTKIKRQFVSDEAAYAMIEEAFAQMNAVEQFAVIFGEGMLGGGMFAKLRNNAAAKDVRVAEGVLDDLKMPFARLSGVPAIQRAERGRTSLNDDLMELGIYNKQLKKEVSQVGDRIDDLNKEMRQVAYDPDFGKKSLKYQRLEAERDNLIRTQKRNWFNTKISPYMQQVVGAEAGLALAATYSRNQFEGAMGMDAETAELMGMIGGLAGELTGTTRFLTRGVTKTVSGVTGVSTGLVGMVGGDGILNPISLTFRKLANQDTTVDDYERFYYMPNNNGKRMSYKERKQVKKAFRQLEKVSDEDRERLLGHIQDQMDLHNDILKIFPEGPARTQASQYLNQSLAEVTGLPQAISAYQMAVEKAQAKGLKNGGLRAMMDNAVAADEKLGRAQFILKGFEEHAAKFGNPQQMGEVTRLIQQTEQILLQAQETMSLEFAKLDERIDAMVSVELSDITDSVDEMFMEDYLEAKEILSKRMSPEVSDKVAGAVLSVRTEKQNILETEKAMLQRFETIRAIRDRKNLHSDSLAAAVETLIFKRNGELARQMDRAYDDFRRFVDTRDVNPNIDLSPAVEKMLDIANVDGKEIVDFFGPQSTFFSGHLGRKARAVFTRMVRRTLNELPEDERAELFTSLVEQGVDAEDLQNMIETSPTQFGLLLHQSGKLNVFARANIEEAEEMRRAFRDYGYKIADDAIARQYKDFQSVIDQAMEVSDKLGYDKLLEAREIYTRLNDPSRPGTPLNRVMKSLQADKSGDTGVYSGLYRNNAETPLNIMSGIGKTTAKIMSGSREKGVAISELREEIGKLETLFGTPGADGVMRIDLSTEEGEVAFELMGEVVEAIVYDAWAADFLAKGPTVGARIGDPRNIGFKQSVIDELEAISDKFNVKVIDKDGNIDEALVFNVTDLINKEKDIANVIVKGGKHHEAGKRAVRELKRKLKLASEESKIKANTQTTAMQKLLDIYNMKNPRAFYEEYISGPGDIDLLRDTFMKAVQTDGSAADVEAAAKLFDTAIHNTVYQGLLAAGGYGPVGRQATSELKGLLGENIVINGFQDVLGALAELEKDTVIRNLDAVLGVEQRKTLTSIMDYLANQQAAQTSMQLAAKGFTANEAISRAYNIARGMVSPSYVMSEVAVRMLQKNSADVLLLAIQSKDAADIIDKMLRYPKTVTGKELNTFATLLDEFLFTEVSRLGLEATLTDYFDTYLGEETDDEQE